MVCRCSGHQGNFCNLFSVAEDNRLVGCRVQSAILSGLTLILIAVTGWMKLVSYAHTNADVRALIKADDKVELEFCLLVS